MGLASFNPSYGRQIYLLLLRFAGTFFPFLRALDSPIAIACLRLFTLPPLPLLAVPRLYRCISFLTSVPELREYLRVRLFAMSFSRDQ